MRATQSVYKEHCPDTAFCAFGLFPCLFIWKQQQQQQSNKEKQEVHVFFSPNNDQQIIVNEFS